MLRYLDRDDREPWNPDFTYAFGYDDPRPDTWSLVYSNYTGTRWRPDRALGEGRSNFRLGTWSLARRFALPVSWRPVFLLDDGDDALCRASADWSPRFENAASVRPGHDRVALTLGCRYTRADGWFAEFTAHAWPGGKQQPWDPDFTYAFGYFDWRPGTVSLQYSNYSGNRLPGRTRAPGQGGLRGGSLTLSWRVDW